MAARVVSTVKAADFGDGSGEASLRRSAAPPHPGAVSAMRTSASQDAGRVTPRCDARRAKPITRDETARPSQLAGMAFDVVDDQVPGTLDVPTKTLGGDVRVA